MRKNSLWNVSDGNWLLFIHTYIKCSASSTLRDSTATSEAKWHQKHFCKIIIIILPFIYTQKGEDSESCNKMAEQIAMLRHFRSMLASKKNSEDFSEKYQHAF